MINACKVPFLWLVLVHQTTQFLILESNFYLRFVNDTVHKKANAYTKKIHTETGTLAKYLGIIFDDKLS